VNKYTDSSAEISSCGKYRYSLTRAWAPGGRACFVMHNPSKATADQDDPTIRKCVGFAKRIGLGEIEVVNLFAMRATDPREVRLEIGTGGGLFAAIGPDNDRHLLAAAGRAARVFVAWGALPAYSRDEWVGETLGPLADLWALKLTSAGRPWHPLYVPYAAEPVLWRRRELVATRLGG
jgi:hypothetical protein